jgi:N-acetylglucosaminyl-diphospho-decaprenol L-rhamnosyltransferase
MTSPQVSAILVNYNAGGELALALRSIADDLAGRPWEAVVVDNASSDGSAGTVAAFAPHARVVQNRENVGFARGVNQGLGATSAPTVLIMNPDCRLAPGAVDALGAELARGDRVALAGPRILNPDGSVQGSARGDPDMLTGLFGRTAALRKALPHLAVSKRNVIAADGRSIEVDWVSGACMLARRSALERVNGFDERYFLYWEDADLCRRLRGQGYEIRYVPAASAIHRVGHSSREVRSTAIRAFHESAYLYYSTHVAPTASPKRLAAKVLLAARCWLKLQQSRPSLE